MMRANNESGMTWHGQINRTIWEINEAIKKAPDNPRLRRELLRAQFLQHFEFDKAYHVPRDDRTFLFLHDADAPIVLLLHGSQGTPAEMRELGNHLHSRGISAYCPRFTRTSGKDEPVSWESWATQAQIALESVCTCSPAAFVCGLSLGGTVALILAEQTPLAGMILLAPALYPRMGLKARCLQVTRIVTPTVFYHFAGWTGEVLKAMDYARKQTRALALPVLALQSADDRHLSPRGLKFLRRRAAHAGSDIRLLAEGSHALMRGAAKAEVFEAVSGFVERNARGVKVVAAVPDAPAAESISDPS